MIATGTARGRRVAGSGRLASGAAARFAIGVAAVAVGLVSVGTSQAAGFSYLTDSAIGELFVVVAGWALVAVGLETLRRSRRSRVGYLLAAAGIAWFLPEWSDPAIGQPIAFTVGLAFLWLYPAVVAHALFAFAGTSAPVRLDRFMALGYALLVVGLGVIPALGFDPLTAGCGLCPANLFDVGGSPVFFDGASRVATVLAVAWVSTTAIVLAYGLIRSGPVTRHVRAPALIPGIVFLVLVGIALGRTIVQIGSPSDPTDRSLRLGQAIALMAVAVGVASVWFQARRSRARVAQVVADLAQSPPVGGLRDHLAAILRDPGLTLAYPVANGMSVDARGRPVDLGSLPGRETTSIVRDGMVVAVIEHDKDVLRDAAEIDEVVAAARLGLEHERLRAEAHAQLDALRAARRRIVEAGDARRRQLERDLHDGAQQRLIALSIGLRFVERDPSINAWLDEATAELRRALDDLRQVAHGIYPSVLADEGFPAAVDALAESSVVPMSIVDMVDARFEAPIEVAAYHVVAEIARGGVGPLQVRALYREQRLTIEVTASSIPDLVAEEIADRVGAVDGSLEIVSDRGAGASLVAEIPCRPVIAVLDDGPSK